MLRFPVRFTLLVVKATHNQTHLAAFLIRGSLC